jgi:16S rRNA (cytidine1402-2'-O)-methyltransferase
MATLYIVSTPIGNLGDITYRAVKVLGEVNRILAEDTRRTSILLRHYGISAPLVSAHEHNEAARAAQLVEWLDAGEEVALVSDAGTPLLSDPGARIVQKVVEAGHRVVPVPGPSALLAALVAAGVEPEPFTFFGFTPRSGRARTERLEEIRVLRHTAVLYEAPGRTARLLAELAERCGAGRRVVVARELTKIHETFYRGTLAEAAAYYEREPARGEVVLVVAGAEDTAPAGEEAPDARELARTLLAEGLRPSAAARELARRLNLPRNQAYEVVLSLSGED